MAGFEQICSLEDFDWGADITVDRRLVDAVFALEFLARSEHVLLVGPVGVGKSFLAQALGYAAVKTGYSVRFARADNFFGDMARSRLNGSSERTFRSYLAPDLLILDDLGLQRFSQQQPLDLYELVIARHQVSSFVITSNRAIEEWLALFADPVLGNSALDRLANSVADQINSPESIIQIPHPADGFFSLLDNSLHPVLGGLGLITAQTVAVAGNVQHHAAVQ